MTTFTLPLIMHHLDFEFVDPEHAKAKPNFQLGTFTAPDIQMIVIPLRKID